jgi:pimeloyl-ACP methyl ester carboxylesterase
VKPLAVDAAWPPEQFRGPLPNGARWLRIVLGEGRKREVRALCAAVHLYIFRLIRVRFGPLELNDLPPGKTRLLTKSELRALGVRPATAARVADEPAVAPVTRPAGRRPRPAARRPAAPVPRPAERAATVPRSGVRNRLPITARGDRMTAYVLVAGAWLGGWCWGEVAARLRAQGQHVYPVTLTGLGERGHLARPETDLETHIMDVVNVLDYEELSNVVLVGHSYAGNVVTGVADQRPERLSRLVYLDTGPPPDGTSMLDFFPPEAIAGMEQQVADQGEGWRLPMPPFERLNESASLAGLDDGMLARIRAKATPQPFGTYRQPLRLSNPPDGPYQREAIFCTETMFSVDTLRAMIAAGEPMVQVFAGPGWRFHELPTGHWPMLSTPGPLAASYS